eukprot:1077331-Pleurochrysis_carterae.AAC.3
MHQHKSSFHTSSPPALFFCPQLMSTYEWQNMSTSGLTKPELGSLLHVFMGSGMAIPKQAESFVALLRSKYAALANEEHVRSRASEKHSSHSLNSAQVREPNSKIVVFGKNRRTCLLLSMRYVKRSTGPSLLYATGQA